MVYHCMDHTAVYYLFMACCTYGSVTPVTKTSLRDTPIYLSLRVPFLAIGWELCVPVRTDALVAPWRVRRYRSPRTAPSRSRDKAATSIAGAQQSGNDFTHADLAPLTLLGGTSARAQVAAADTAFVMAIHGATFVSMPPVIADVDPTSIGSIR